MSDDISSGADKSPSAEKFAEQAHDLSAARKSVEEAASVSTGLWLSYLAVLVYLGIAAGAVTHKDLLLENPVKLPFLSDVPLPLKAFIVLAPIVLIISHAYALVHFVMLAAKVDVFNTELKNQPGNAAETEEYSRWQLPSNIFVQLLAGPAYLRKGMIGFISNIMAWITLVIGPVFLLLLIQVQFLPFHLWWGTLVHRCAIFADLGVLWALWPAVIDNQSKLTWPRPWRHKGLAAATLVVIGLAFTAATFPAESMDDWVGRRAWIPPNPVTAWLGQTDDQGQPVWTSVHDLLFHGPYDPRVQRRKSPFSNTLLLPEFDVLEAAKIDNPAKLDTVPQTIARKRQHFEQALFRGADLRKANLENAYLEGVDFYQAKLQGARFFQAHLPGAELYQAHLQGASLDSAELQGGRLSRAELQGGWLFGAELQGAILDDAQLQGASLEGAHLEGASLKGAHLQGASLKGAHLQGASLEGAELQGASLDDAQLQGAQFLKATLEGATVRNVAAWRTSLEDASLTAVFLRGVNQNALTKEEFGSLKMYFMQEVPEGGQREQALNRIEILNPDIAGREAHARVGPEMESGEESVNESAYEKSLADQLKSLVCSKDKSAIYILRGLVANGRVRGAGTQAARLVEGIIGPRAAQDCPVSAVLTEEDKAALERVAEEASSAR
ncbi:MAG TPA: pentapeptide repeat-containing protein [Methylocella sp.]|nr:pentapeptide repeat-containing protein [Methylocella sp.]